MESRPASFREDLRRDLEAFVAEQWQRFPDDESLFVDLHCHDHNSDVPDELLGRILRWPETWVSTDEVREALGRNGMSALTITNHNNARSCFELLDRGVDVLVGAEFTCTVPDFDAHIHVLTYGFGPAQEERLASLRGDLYPFLAYAREQDLVTVLAHPLFFHSPHRVPTLALLEKLTLLFDHFEVLNGQRDTWQNLLVVAWLQGLNEQRVAEMALRARVPAELHARRAVRKALTGGSDDHMAMFVGTTGSRVHVPDLARRLKQEPRSALVLEALRSGEVAPFGSYTGEEKLAASFLDYFCQIARNAEDPGLLRLLLHQGTARQKITALLAANAMFELRRHRYTSRFIDAAHQALHGKTLGVVRRHSFSKEYRPIARELDRIARTRADAPGALDEQLKTSVPAIFHELTRILADRVRAKLEKSASARGGEPLDLQEFIRRLEVPADLRALFGDGAGTSPAPPMSRLDLRSVAEGLPFPALAAAIVGGATYTSTKVLFSNRPLLDEFSQAIGRYQHPKRALWLTDTFFDENDVAGVLRLVHGEAVRRDLPVDFAVCASRTATDEHLKVLSPVGEFELPFGGLGPLRAFDLLELQRLFADGAYDRILCSTEGPMGLAALYLKNAFSVPAFFYVHADWMDFARRTLKLDARNADRVRRLLRAFYRSFDGLFALSSEHLAWLASEAMGIPEDRLRQTAQWVEEHFCPRPVAKGEVFGGVGDHEPVMLYVGRLSEEKGVLELPRILEQVRRKVPGTRLVLAGRGPAEDRLRAELADALFLSWVEPAQLARVYPAADVLVLPSRFDTFGRAVLEALSCGTPVVAYRAGGPKDIIQDGTCGYAVADQAALVDGLARILGDQTLREQMRAAAVRRSRDFRPDGILDALMRDLGLASDATGGLAGIRSSRLEDELGEWASSDGELPSQRSGGT